MYFNTHSWFSFKYGTFDPETLVPMAVERGIHTLALTDINSTTGSLYFAAECKKHGLKAILGIEFRDAEGQILYIGLAANAAGYGRLNTFLTHHLISGLPLPARPPWMEHVHFIYLWGSRILPEDLGPQEWIGLPPMRKNRWLADRVLKRHASRLIFCHTLTFSTAWAPGQYKPKPSALDRVIEQQVSSSWYEVHKYLCAIDNNLLVTALEPRHTASPDETFLRPEELEPLFEQFPEIFNRTRLLEDALGFDDFDFDSPKNLQTYTGDIAEDLALLKKLAHQGLIERYGDSEPEILKAHQRMESEMAVIEKLGFVAYYLTTWDIVQYARQRDFYHIGRGSGANSLVAYCLRITDVDPLELDLYFERFLNPKRSSPPDFDIDFSWQDRDEIYNYMFRRFNKPGEHRVSLLGTICTFGDRSTVRELGKAHGLPKYEIDRIEDEPDSPLNQNGVVAAMMELLNRMDPPTGGRRKHMPSHLGIHAGGVLISERPITDYCALYMPPKGYATAQMDMYGTEAIRLEKLDILSQRGIGHIRMAAKIIEKNRDEKVDVFDFKAFKKDPLIAQNLKEAQTIGCFYIESPAMRQLLTKLGCSDYLTLVAASSIIRPGVAQSGMMNEYINRFHNAGNFQYLHPVMEQQLGETYGVMVYQEDVLKVCHHYSGMDLAEADILRRAMSGKYRSSAAFQAIEDSFFNGAAALGRPPETTAEIWRQVSSFGGYSFCKAHSASFAVESYQSLFLKTYYPLEFYTAVINNFGGFYRTWVYVHAAEKAGAVLHPPCVNRGSFLTDLQGNNLYLGFVHVKGLEKAWADKVVEERNLNGKYHSANDLVNRTGINPEQLNILIRVGALRFTGKSKRQLSLEAAVLTSARIKPNRSYSLFSENEGWNLPSPETLASCSEKMEDAFDELFLLGFPVSLSLFDMLKTPFRGQLQASEMAAYEGQTVKMLGRLVCWKPVRTRRGDLMAFGTFLDYQGAFFDTTHFSQSLKQYPIRHEGIYLILGKVVKEFNFYTLEVQKLARLETITDPRWDYSRPAA